MRKSGIRIAISYIVVNDSNNTNGFEKSLEGEQKWPPVMYKSVPRIALGDYKTVEEFEDKVYGPIQPTKEESKTP